MWYVSPWETQQISDELTSWRLKKKREMFFRKKHVIVIRLLFGETLVTEKEDREDKQGHKGILCLLSICIHWPSGEYKKNLDYLIE